jgi:hypothetical protein
MAPHQIIILMIISLLIFLDVTTNKAVIGPYSAGAVLFIILKYSNLHNHNGMKLVASSTIQAWLLQIE